ncbi:MAG: DUF58 domain-containing protein [Myxococcales bacterium]|nr:DUF58 domain-containing protein [Myxococcales bacterium]
MLAAAPSLAMPEASPSRWRRLQAWIASPTALRQLTFTREGKWITFLAIAIGIAAINTGNNLLYLLVGWLLSFIVASGVLSEWALRDVEIERRLPSMVFAGEPVVIELTAHNRHGSRAAYSLEVTDVVDGAALDKRCYVLRIAAAGAQTLTYSHIFTQRGLHHISGVRLATRFPFGFFHKTRIIALPEQIMVLPARVQVRALPPRPTRRGETSASKIGRDGEFYGIREQRLGDDRRSIHWSSTAKMGRYMVREREQEQAHQTSIYVEHGVTDEARALVANHSPSGLACRLAYERAISYAASLAAFYLDRGYLVEVIGRGLAVPPGGGRAHTAAVLRALALAPLVDAATPFAASKLPSGARVFVRPKLAIGGARPEAMVVEV